VIKKDKKYTGQR